MDSALLPGMAIWAIAVKKAMAELRRIRAKENDNWALNIRNGPNIYCILDLLLYSKVMVFRKEVIGIGYIEWEGPYKIHAFDNHDVLFDIPNRII